jgi:hypothetical protein
MSKGGDRMQIKGLAIAVGVGAAVGAVAILAMPKNNPTRRLATKAADKMEDMTWKLSNKLTDEFNL